jgi:hypothetical protein
MKITFAHCGLLAIPLMLAGCQRDNTEDAPVTTKSPAGTSTAPSSEAAEDRDTALVRVVHAIPGAASVDVFADDTRAFDGLAFKAVTPYREIDGQRYTFRLRAAGQAQGEPLASNTEGLDDGDYYTVFAVPGDDDKAMLRVVQDDHSRPGDGKARVRVVHASRDVGEVDLYAVGRDDALFDGIDFQSVTDYDEVDAFTGALQLRHEDGDNVVLDVPNVRLDAGKSYTIVVVGRVKTAPRLEAFVIEDQAMAAPAS